MLIKTLKLPWLLLMMVSLLTSMTHANAESQSGTMLWEMLANESLTELAAKFYPKSGTMQRAFIVKTQQLNQDTQVYANPNARYPDATKIKIPTLKSLSVKGVSAKRYKRAKKATVAEKSSTETPTALAQLTEKKAALDASLVKESESLAALKKQMSALQKQLDQSNAASTETNP